jgi:nitroimidazol reductase NimA-like FMN-containing flavoprotein (pyridoxamine 5'-phosphate oxidase superfamily)
MQQVRRKDREISAEEAMVILRQAEYGVLSTVAGDGQPYGVPLNFCVIDQSLYFHCALCGRKIDSISNHPLVSFCAVGKTAVLPAEFGTKYESVIVSGTAAEVLGREKQMALEGLVQKYAPDFIDQGRTYIKAMYDKTRVFRITIQQISGKSRR